jgi:flagellar biogenesis protein FliO
MIDSGLGALDLIDLATKCVVVVGLLLITLRVLGRMQAAGPRRAGHLQVLESRALASKASLHLVAVGDRRLVVGLTPSGMVSLAELKADEIEAEAAALPAVDFAAELAAQESAANLGPVAASTASASAASSAAAPRALIAPGSPLGTIVAPIDAVAGRLATLLSGGRAR